MSKNQLMQFLRSGDLSSAEQKELAELLDGEVCWDGVVDCCDAKGMWLVMADNCPLVTGQSVRILPRSP